MVFTAKGGIKMAPKAPYLPSGTVLHTSRGRSPQPVREASAGPGQNPWRPGPKARQRHQPSPAKAGVNLREYWKAPPRSRSRSRPRRRHLNPQAQKGLDQMAPTAALMLKSPRLFKAGGCSAGGIRFLQIHWLFHGPVLFLLLFPDGSLPGRRRLLP